MESQNTRYLARQQGGSLVATVTERPVAIAPMEVLIHVKAVAINPADYKMIDEGHRVNSWPLAPGLDGAGVVEGVGANVKNVALGDRVLALFTAGDYAASYQTFAVVEEKSVAKIPNSWSFENAASLGVCYLTGIMALGIGLKSPLPFLRDGPISGLRPSSALILGGSSAVGSATIQLLRLAIPDCMILTTSSPRHHAHLTKYLNADYAFDRGSASLVTDVKSVTPGCRGVDVIIDVVGAGGMQPDIFNVLDNHGPQKYAQVWTGNDQIQAPSGVNSVMFRGRDLPQLSGNANIVPTLETLLREGRYKLPLPVRIVGRGLDGLEKGLGLMRQGQPSIAAGFTNAVTKERVRYDEVKEHAVSISTALTRKFGFCQGECVALFSSNTVWYPVAMFATIRIGGMISGASPAYNVEEMTYALKTSKARILMTAASALPVAIPAAKNAGIPQDRIILLEGRHQGFATIHDLIKFGRGFGAGGQTPALKIKKGETNKWLCGFLSFSSGTTGLPKAVMISHHNVMAQCLQVSQLTPKDHKKILAVLPLFHITGLVHQMHTPVCINAEVFMLPAFDMKTMLDTVVEYQISELLLVPPILIRLLRDPIVKNYDLSHIRRFSSGAAPLSAEVIQELQRRFPQTGFKQGYGMTESCSCITAHPIEQSTYEYANRVGSIVANTEVKIVDPETGTELGYGEPGEILARGPQIVMGYLDNEKATAETFDSEAWLHTGDVGYIDREGFITITDRIKEMIKVKGIAVAPAELEDLLLGHPMIEDVAVGAIADDYTGQRPKAYIVLKPTFREGKGKEQVLALLRGVIQYVQEKKVRHKWITEVELVKEIPKSASGKILRRVLRQLEQDANIQDRVLVGREDVRSKL
ncbi:hypothetical protein N7513_001724 [Penicillium frequentans]|nr:hypothetical protein N7513_001724 [Penicillium glabrum]